MLGLILAILFVAMILAPAIATALQRAHTRGNGL